MKYFITCKGFHASIGGSVYDNEKEEVKVVVNGKNENEAKDKAIKLLYNRGYNFIDIVKCKIFK